MLDSRFLSKKEGLFFDWGSCCRLPAREGLVREYCQGDVLGVSNGLSDGFTALLCFFTVILSVFGLVSSFRDTFQP